MADGRDGIVIAGAVVVGDIQTPIVSGAVRGGSTHVPAVGLAAVDGLPSVGFEGVGKGADVGIAGDGSATQGSKGV